MKLKLRAKYLIFAILAAVFTVVDQMSKEWIVNVTENVEGRGFTVIKGIINFTFVKNDGASMGLFGGQRIFLILVTVAVFAFGLWYFIKNRPDNMLFLSATSLIASGAVGNLIDRIQLGYVRDFIDLDFVNFYIFNFADCAICVGAGLLILYAFINIKE
ncbi:MAG: signal peptidase II [Clostridia bacterium]|nr:signal peptidase II [Clostridia bacterium]